MKNTQSYLLTDLNVLAVLTRVKYSTTRGDRSASTDIIYPALSFIISLWQIVPYTAFYRTNIRKHFALMLKGQKRDSA